MNSLLLREAIVEALLASGVRDVLLVPDSRNAPIPLALHAVETIGLLGSHIRTDERVAAFIVLGMAKASGRVVAVATTSGTATGNLVPAAIEARTFGIPLLLLTADCPAHLVGTGASQTCDQLGIFGPAVIGVLRLASGTGTESAWCVTITRACALAVGIRTRRPEPVQVNVEFETPLVDVATPASEPQQARPVIAPSAGTEVCEATGMACTVVLAGDAPPVVGAEVRATAEMAGVPPLAKPFSNARTDSAVPRYRESLLALGPEIERVMVFGHPTLSRPVTELLGRGDIELIVATPYADWTDPGHAAARVVDHVLLPPGDPAWLTRWRDPGDATPRESQELTGEIVAAEVVAATRPGESLVFSASSSTRYADLASVNPNSGLCWVDRGLAGIDGTVVMVTGIILATGVPATLLLGDLTLQHDLGALVTSDAGREVRLCVTLLDDHGGAIFVSLEQGQPAFAASFDRVSRTPQGVELSSVVRSMGQRTSEVIYIQLLRQVPARPSSDRGLLHIVSGQDQPSRSGE